jgi:hypothetical protein
MYDELADFLEAAMLDNARVEVAAKDGKTFTGVSAGMDEGYDDDLGWFFNDVIGSVYGSIPLGKIAKVQRIDEPNKIVYAPKVA